MRTLAYLLKQYESDPATTADITAVHALAKADDIDGVNAVLKAYEGTDDLHAIAAAAKIAFSAKGAPVDTPDPALVDTLTALTKILKAVAIVN